MSKADERIRENMKSYNHLYEKTISETNRRYALSQAKHSKRFRKIMKHRHMSDDAAVEQSLDWIVNYENAEHVPVYIYDGITRKERTIIVPTMEELLVQHCIVNAMKPMFCKGMYEHSYASLPGRGAHKGKQVIEKWIRTDPKNCKYVLKMDIRHFFDSIPHDHLKAKLKKTVHDEKMLDLLFRATRKARKISKKEKATILDARQMLSYLGWIDCTDTYLMYRKWIKPCVSFQQLKRKVSQYDKYDEKRVYQKLVSLYTAKGGKSHGIKLQICREHSPTDCT